jgi:hypothetical protein
MQVHQDYEGVGTDEDDLRWQVTFYAENTPGGKV